MSAGGMPADMQLPRIAAEFLRVLVAPGDAPAHLIGHGHQVAPGLVDVAEVENRAMRTRVHEHFREIGELGGAAVAPGATMDEHGDRRFRAPGAIEVESLDRSRT